MTTTIANKLAALFHSLLWIVMAIVAAVLAFIYDNIIPLAGIATAYLILK